MRKAIRHVHQSLKKTHPHIVRKVSEHWHLKYKYPKLTFLGILIILTYFIFQLPEVSSFFGTLNNPSLSYLGIFLAGLLFSYGFTTPFGVALFLTIDPANIHTAVLIGAVGAYLSDLLIFGMIKSSFMDEFLEIEETKPMRKFAHVINNNLTKRLKLYLLYVFAGIILATPIPDEFGVALLAGLGHIRGPMFALLSFLSKAIAIYIILLI